MKISGIILKGGCMSQYEGLVMETPTKEEAPKQELYLTAEDVHAIMNNSGDYEFILSH